MEILLLALVAVGAIETTYLVYKSRPKTHVEQHSLLLDTSVLIDGRILPIARSGLMTAPVVIPRSVVRELQYMADKADHDKRERAREGLDMIDQLQHIEGLTVRLIDDPELKNGGVDERLVELAKESNARLCTIDYNLNKAARVQGVIVVNINELAHALRIVHLPGETVELKLVQSGQESRQAVGYLDDGTMVVVDDAKAQIGHVVEVEVTRVLQTAAGKMMFARKAGKQFSERTSTEAEGRGKMFAKKNSRRSQTTNKANVVTEKQQNGSGQPSSQETTAVAQAGPSVQENPPVAIPVPDVPKPPRSPRPSNQNRNPRQQNQRRSRQTPEDSFIDQLTKQQ
jgi:rRNA-processing protein FCF1